MPKIPGIDTSLFEKNYIINGDMRIAQRGTSFVAIADSVYSLDRFIYQKSGAMVHTASQDTDAPTLAEADYLFQNSLRLNLTTPDTSIAAGDYALVSQKIEGYNWTNLAQKYCTLSFWVKATLSGTYCVSFNNTGSDRSYIAEYVINAANTWEYKTVLVPPSPSAGSWNYVNGTGIIVRWTLAAGSTFQTTAGSWQTENYFATANQVNGVNTGATDFRITGVMLNEGLVAAPFSTFDKSIEGDLDSCERYYQKSYRYSIAPGTPDSQGNYANRGIASSNNEVSIELATRMRTQPTATAYSTTTGAANMARDNSAGVDVSATSSGFRGEKSVAFLVTQTAGNQYTWHWTADAEL